MECVTGCKKCQQGEGICIGLSMAFQPIFDIRTGEAWAYEALVRGTEGQSAADILSSVTPENRYAFDQACRVAAIEQSVAAGILNTDAKLSINFLPNAIYSVEACIRLTLQTAAEQGLATSRLLFEFTENEKMANTDHIKNILKSYKQMGFATALDDFGAGYAGLQLLADFQTDFIKLDMALIRNIDEDMPRRMIVDSIVKLCRRMGIVIIAEGVETPDELAAIRNMGIDLVQGFLLARPGFEKLPELAYDLDAGAPLEKKAAA
tara:strand:- start:2771 stop:3562 length:792 start_codon:yes stop_codon:yes gene_type:complete